jgi:hypothetical protein
MTSQGQVAAFPLPASSAYPFVVPIAQKHLSLLAAPNIIANIEQYSGI